MQKCLVNLHKIAILDTMAFDIRTWDRYNISKLIMQRAFFGQKENEGDN